MEELGADAVVHPDPARDVLHVCADLLAQVGDLVDEGDLRREEGVGGVLDQLARPTTDEQDRRFVEEQRAIDFAHHVTPEIVLGPDHDPVGPLEIADRGAFAQEFGIGDDRDLQAAISHRCALQQDPLDLVAGADGHGRFGDDDRVVDQRFADFAGDGMDERQVCVAIAPAAGGAHRDEDGARSLYPFGEIGREGKASGARVAVDQRVKPRFVDRHDAFAKTFDLRGVLVDAHDIMAEIGETGPRDEADIARPDHCDFHAFRPFMSRRPIFRSTRSLRPPRRLRFALLV